MAIPDFQSIMLPLLRIASDSNIHTMEEARERLAVEFGLSEKDRMELLPSGTQRRFDNRVAWARVDLGKALLLESCGRGSFRITNRGLELLKENPSRINIPFLRRYSEYAKFRKASKESDSTDGISISPSNDVAIETPEEAIERGYLNIRTELASKVLEKVRQCSPKFFEKLVVELLIALGYGGSFPEAGMVIGGVGDGGIDGVIKEDKLGLDLVCVQAKRWENTVGRPIVQAFAGSLEGHRAKKGVLITTSTFSSDAKKYVEQIEKRIVLIDGEQLAELMIDNNVGVAEKATYVIKRLDGDYFEEE